MRTFWTTFYSYKGGVGRTLALANTAALLVKRGRRVVLIDFDLEAPGLDSFQELKEATGKPGVVEYVSDFERNAQAPDISAYVHPCESKPGLRGKLWVMPAGRKDSSYNSARAKLDWADLYERGIGEPFVENWKAAIHRYCEPDYVFVDSRTGLTDVAGICTLHLPDLVVMVFGLNDQNVKGVAAVAKTIRESDYARLPQLHYVASPLPNLPTEKEGLLAKRLNAAVVQLGTKIESSVRYHAVAGLTEGMFVLADDLDSLPLVRDYENLLSKITEYNRNGLDFLLEQSKEAIRNVDTSLMKRLLAFFEQEYPQRAEALLARAQLSKILGDHSSANSLARGALTTDPTYESALDWLLSDCTREKKYEAAVQLCDATLQHTERLSEYSRYDVTMKKANFCMAAGDWAGARDSFRFCFNFFNEKKKEGDADPVTLMIHFFNWLEASRRLTRTVEMKNWRAVLNLFETVGETSNAPLLFQANRWQAIHIAFALTGDIARARDALSKAHHAAEIVGLAEDIFSVKTYTNVSAKEFIEINNEMLAALDQGRLWDGMPLPTAPASPEPTAEPVEAVKPKSVKRRVVRTKRLPPSSSS
jgi:MinD-like ATPase involved in chromosome partitioning or flagellar assembly